MKKNMKIHALFLSISLSGAGMPASAITVADAKNLLINTAQKAALFVQSEPAKVAGAIALGAASWYLYNKFQTYKRTYYIGNEKFIVPQGSLVRVRNNDFSQFAYRTSYFFSLGNQKLHLLKLSRGKNPSNTLQVFHDSYKNASGMRMIIYSDAPYNGTPSVAINSQTKDLTTTLTNPESVERVDYIFMRPMSHSNENNN